MTIQYTATNNLILRTMLQRLTYVT